MTNKKFPLYFTSYIIQNIIPQNNLKLPETGITPDLSAFIPKELKAIEKDKFTPKIISKKVKFLVLMILGMFTAAVTGCDKSEEATLKLKTDFAAAEKDCKNTIGKQNKELEDLKKLLKTAQDEKDKCRIELTEKNKPQQDEKNEKIDQQQKKEEHLGKITQDILRQVLGADDNVILLKSHLHDILINFLISFDEYYSLDEIFPKCESRVKNLLLNWFAKNPNQAQQILDNALKQLKNEEKMEFIKKIAELIKTCENGLKIYNQYKNIIDKHPDWADYDERTDAYTKNNYEQDPYTYRVIGCKKFAANPAKEKQHVSYENLYGTEKFVLRMLRSFDKKGLLPEVKTLISNVKKQLSLK
ncbi:hypothetical protein HZA39_02070 [Candidatus Peregrinibacteria bacterium]|nr:hypothetical protein [Candidatus Peregrinibacteria bacterium]